MHITASLLIKKKVIKIENNFKNGQFTANFSGN
ncbi:hypothetical protein BC952_0148 [Flavobacterium limicola]|uniref:Uncharacterized protein n=1 Tax=Flavobacterium limicola TaxID=180441 RepID=A0A495S4D1_9FLAO|nr:hypothetical protein BC952_0148 [Flavobacterium limicola]